MMPNLNVWLSNEVPNVLRGRALGGLTTFMFLGQFLSPIVSQPVSQALGMTATYGLAGVVLVVAASLIWIFKKQIAMLYSIPVQTVAQPNKCSHASTGCLADPFHKPISSGEKMIKFSVPTLQDEKSAQELKEIILAAESDATVEIDIQTKTASMDSAASEEVFNELIVASGHSAETIS